VLKTAQQYKAAQQRGSLKQTTAARSSTTQHTAAAATATPGNATAPAISIAEHIQQIKHYSLTLT
jgi:hypothetical protein